MPLKTADIPRPMVFVAMATMAGLVAGHDIDLNAAPALATGGLLLAWSTLRYWQSRRVDGPAHLSPLPLFLILIILGMVQSSRIDQIDREDALTARQAAGLDTILIQGTVAEEPRVKLHSTQILLKNIVVTPPAGSEAIAPLHGKVALTVKNGPDGSMAPNPEILPLPGQTVRLSGHLQPPETGRNPGAFDTEAYWHGRGVAALALADGFDKIEVLDAPLSLASRFLRLTRRARTALGNRMDSQLQPEEAALARALFLGESWRLDQGQIEAFKQTGLMHVLCVSGLHTGFILLLLLAMGRVAGLSPRRCALLGMAGLLAYACLTGLRPPVVRAALMADLILGGLVLARQISPLASFATAAFLTLTVDPRNLLRIDWQLSYLCVGSILVFTPPIFDLITRWPKDPLLQQSLPTPTPWAYWTRQYVLMPLAVSLAIQLGVVPFQILKFGQVNPLLIVNNLVGTNLTMFAVLSLALSAMVCAVAGVLSWAGHWAQIAGEALVWLSFQASHVLLWLLGTAVDKLARHGAMPIRPGTLPLWFMAGYYGLLTGGMWLRRGRDAHGRLDRRQRGGATLTIMACLALIVWTPLVPHGGGFLDLFMLDVGQGDGMVVRFPNGKIMVIDAGDRRPIDQGAWTLAPFLQTIGAQRIDCLVATHGDSDHIGGMASLVRQLPVGLLLHGAGTDKKTVFNQELDAAVRERHVATQRPTSGDTLGGFGSARVSVLAPGPADTGNDGSLVLEIAYGRTEILLTGDLELKGERKLMDKGLSGDIEVLKVGHHGSLSSTSGPFLAACRPELALISVGRDNRFGHPSAAVIERLEQAGAQCLRTDQMGALWIRTDGRAIEAYRFLGR